MIVVAGAGAIGANLAYQLALLGVRDVVLCDRGQIAGGSTSRAMGGVRQQFSTAAEVRLAQDSLGFFEQPPHIAVNQDSTAAGSAIQRDDTLVRELGQGDLRRADTRAERRRQRPDRRQRIARARLEKLSRDAASQLLGFADSSLPLKGDRGRARHRAPLILGRTVGLSNITS